MPRRHSQTRKRVARGDPFLWHAGNSLSYSGSIFSSA